MSLKHFEHLANLERNIIKQQFVNAAKKPVPPTLPFGPKIPLKEKRLKGKQKPKLQTFEESQPQAQ